MNLRLKEKDVEVTVKKEEKITVRELRMMDKDFNLVEEVGCFITCEEEKVSFLMGYDDDRGEGFEEYEKQVLKEIKYATYRYGKLMFLDRKQGYEKGLLSYELEEKIRKDFNLEKNKKISYVKGMKSKNMSYEINDVKTKCENGLMEVDLNGFKKENFGSRMVYELYVEKENGLYDVYEWDIAVIDIK